MNSDKFPFTKSDARSLPNAIDLEENVLASIFMCPADVPGIISDKGLKTEHFYLKVHQTIFDLCMDLVRVGKLPELNAIAVHLEQLGKLDEIGGKGKLADLIGNGYAANAGPHLEAWIDKIIQDHVRREGIRKYQAGIENLHNPEIKPEEAFEKVSRDTYELVSQRAERYQLISSGDSVASVFTSLQTPDEMKWLIGIRELDNLTNGLPVGYTIVAGRTSMGKTHFGLFIAHAMANYGPVLIISAEMSAEKLTQRLLAKISRIESNRIRAKQITDDEWIKLAEAGNVLSGLPIEIYDKPNPQEIDIRQRVQQIIRKYGRPPGMILVDHLQKLSWNPNLNRVQDLERISNRLYEMSKDYKTRVLTLAQINRGVEGRADKRPLMSDIKDSGIEQDGDIVILLYRDEYYNDTSADNGITELAVVKNRDGETKTIKVLHELPYGNYIGLDKPIIHTYSLKKPLEVDDDF